MKLKKVRKGRVTLLKIDEKGHDEQVMTRKLRPVRGQWSLWVRLDPTGKRRVADLIRILLAAGWEASEDEFC